MGTNEQYEQFGFLPKVPEDDPQIYYVLELGKRYLLDPICWVKKPSTMPECIKNMDVESLAVLYEGYCFFVFECEYTNNFSLLERYINPEFAIETIRKRLELYSAQARSDYILSQTGETLDEQPDWIKNRELQNIRGQMRDIHSRFAKNTNQAIFKMINDFRYYVFLALGFKTTNSIVYDDHEKDIRKLEKEVQEIKGLLANEGDSTLSIILALSEEINGTSLIIRNETDPKYYQRNKAFKNPMHVKDKWLNEVKKRIKAKGLKEPTNWEELGRNYIRQPNGKPYAQFTKDMHKW